VSDLYFNVLLVQIFPHKIFRRGRNNETIKTAGRERVNERVSFTSSARAAV